MFINERDAECQLEISDNKEVITPPPKWSSWILYFQEGDPEVVHTASTPIPLVWT